MAQLIVVWDGASYHRACVVRDAAEALNIDLVPLPGYLHAGRGALALARRMSPIITAIPPPRISAAGWPLSKHASIRTPAPSLTDSGSKITSTPTKKNYASQGRRGLAESVYRILAEVGYIADTRSYRLQSVRISAEVMAYLRENDERYVLRCIQVSL